MGSSADLRSGVNIFSLIKSAIYLLIAVFVAPIARAQALEVLWNAGGAAHALKSWSTAELQGFKAQLRHEKDPSGGGKLASWKGVLLQDLVDRAMETLSGEMRAQVDLLVLRGKGGLVALMPRSVVVKYPVLVAWERDSKPLGFAESIVPWSSRPRVMQEGLPVESFFVAGLDQIELTNARERFGPLYLIRRTDPAAMRGEKLFVQNCVGCHVGGAAGPGVSTIARESATRGLASRGHPAAVRLAALTDRDRRTLVSYLDAYRAEHGEGAAAAPSRSHPVMLYLPRQQ